MARPPRQSALERILAEDTTPAPSGMLLQTVIAAAVAPLADADVGAIRRSGAGGCIPRKHLRRTRWITIVPKLLDAYAGVYLSAVTDSLMT